MAQPIDFATISKHKSHIQEIKEKLKDIDYKITYDSCIKTDSKNTKYLESFFEKLNKHYSKFAKHTTYKILIRSEQQIESFTLDNFSDQEFDKNLEQLQCIEITLINNSKGNPSFGIYVYFIEFAAAPTGGTKIDEIIRKAA